MVINRLFVKVMIVSSVLVSAYSPFFTVGGFAAPMRLECVLTSAGADDKETTRTILVVFDAERNTLVSYQGARPREFADVTISTVSINGNTDDISIGIDRSSWSIVVQTYSQDRVSGELGTCRPAAMSRP
jgi:hypothetical protein